MVVFNDKKDGYLSGHQDYTIVSSGEARCLSKNNTDRNCQTGNWTGVLTIKLQKLKTGDNWSEDFKKYSTNMYGDYYKPEIEEKSTKTLGKGVMVRNEKNHSWSWNFYDPDRQYWVEFYDEDYPDIPEFGPTQQKIIDSFAFLPERKDKNRTIGETQFDACGKLDSYSRSNWIRSFSKRVVESEVSLKQIEEVCAALDGSVIIFSFQPSYCGTPEIYRYLVKDDALSLATVDALRKSGCLGTPTKFGKRQGLIIPMVNSDGDAGCGSTSYFEYNYSENNIKLKKEFSQCVGEEGRWSYF